MLWDLMLYADHHRGRFDDGVGTFADLQAQLFDRFERNGRADVVAAAYVKLYDRIHRALFDGGDFAFELVSSTDFHRCSFV